MAIDKKQTNFKQNAKQQLDNSVHELDVATLSKLNQARQYALSQDVKARPVYLSWFTGLLTTFAVAILVITIIPTSPQQLIPDLTTEQWDVLVMADEEELDLYSELEFYQWLDELDG